MQKIINYCLMRFNVQNIPGIFQMFCTLPQCKQGKHWWSQMSCANVKLT